MNNKKINQMTQDELIRKQIELEYPLYHVKEWETKTGIKRKKEWFSDQKQSRYYREIMNELVQRVVSL